MCEVILPTYEYKCVNCGEIEIFHSIKDRPWNICPECKTDGLERLLSVGGGVIIKNREANQYSDILKAKYWRDKNGVRHKVTSGDGHSGSGTVKKQTVSDEVVQARKKASTKRIRREQRNASYDRYINNIKK
jgi:putative FmdB family regulatory protein